MTIRTVATLAALTIALTACTSEAKKPTVLPPAPSSSPTAAAPVPVPPEATAETAEGASAFASYYMQLIGAAFATADAAALTEYSATGCGGCDALIESVEGLRSQGRMRVGGDYVVREALAPAVVDGDVIVDVSYERQAGRVVDTSGQVFATAAPVALTSAQLRLIRRGNTWVVQGYRVLEG